MPLNIDNYTDDILKEISIEVQRGSHLTIIGANGAGKTTLAKLLCGLSPSEKVRIDGRSITTMHPKERAAAVNYLPPKLEVYDAYLRVDEFLALSHLNNALSPHEAMMQTGITHLADKACKALSSGEAQLLLLTSALLHGAVYTIFDEPTANLDPVRTKKVFNLLKHHTRFQSKIIITHNLDLAYHLGYDILYLEEGKTAFYGSTEAFFKQSHLDSFYAGSVRNTGSHVVVSL
jgi:iron complex transport system ATP-binding protein